MQIKEYIIDKYQQYRWRKDSLFAVLAGIATALTIYAGSAAVKRASGGKAIALLESTFPTTRFMAMGMMTASATILALMVTLLSFNNQTKNKTPQITLRRIRQIAFFDTLAFVLAIVFLSLHTWPLRELPIEDPETLTTIYHGVLLIAGLMAGLLVGVMSLLYFAVKEMIRNVE